MSEEISKLLNSQDKGASEATGVLSKLFRRILFDIGMRPMTWDRKMEEYLNSPRNGGSRNSRKRSSDRGNLNKELRKADMTWANFLKGIAFLNPIKIRFEVHCTWENKKTTIHGINVKSRTYKEDLPNE